jgi:hypothetical protein
MLEELRLNPRAPGARSWGRRPGEAAVTDSDKVNRSLSTGFAGRRGAASTGVGRTRKREFEEVVG